MLKLNNYIDWKNSANFFIVAPLFVYTNLQIRKTTQSSNLGHSQDFGNNFHIHMVDF